MTRDLYHNLTEYEKAALEGVFNLADAHTHQSQSHGQRGIIGRLDQIWYEAEKRSQSYFDQLFISTFFQSQGQETALTINRTLLAYSASVNLMIVANWLMKRKARIGLLEPCFDNLPDLMWQSHIELVPISEEQFRSDPNKVWDLALDGLFLLFPNNPTGFLAFQDEEEFRDFVKTGASKQKLLILDLCFAPFLMMPGNPGRFDMYKVLEEAKCTYLTIEDTGKTWPVLDAKCSALTASEDIFQDILDIQSDVLLNVSPFILNLLTAYIKESSSNNYAALSEVILPNFTYLTSIAPQIGMKIQKGDSLVSVAWLKILSAQQDALSTQHYFEQNGVHVLPGNYFFWSNKRRGGEYLRVALARDRNVFEEAVNRLMNLQPLCES